jgi:adenylate cyclase
MIVDSKKHDLWTYLKRNKPSNGFRAHDLSDDSALETYEWRIPISSGKGIMPSVANSGESINVPDVKSEARYAGLYDRHVGSEGVFVTQSLICTPVFDAAGNIVAVLQLMNKVAAGVGAAPNSRPDSNADSLATAFSKDDEIVLQSMNKIVGAILPNALEHNGLDTAFTNAETIRGVFHSLLCNSFLYDQVDAISKGACTLVGADECTIYLVDALSGQLVVHLSPDDIKVLNEAVESGATTVPPGSELMAKGEVRMPLGTSSGLPGHVGVAGDSYAVGNALLDRHIHSPTHWRTGTKMETVLCIPIYNSRHIVSGVLELVNKHGGGSPFATDDEHLLQSLVVPSGIFLENYASLRAVSSEAEQMQTKLSNLNHIIFTIDASGRLLKCNKPVELQSLCGDTIKGMQSSGIESWIDRGDSKSLFREDIRAVLGTKTHVWANDFCLTGADGVAEHINYMVKRIRKAASDVSEAEVLITIEKMSSDPDRSLQEALYRRLPHEIAHRATAEPHLGAIGPTTALRCHATLVYIDLLNVNSVTEGIPEDQSVKLMNKYVQSVSATIRQEGGFIAGMNANTMLAAFGVPFASEQDSLSACRAALEVNQCVQRLNRVLLPSQGSFVVAMAIHTGQMLWGGIRDDKSADYCVFGQTVNTVTSLFDVCKRGRKEYMGRPGGSAVLTGATFAEVQTRLVARELDLVAVPSQTELVALYELLGESESEVSAQLLKALPFYNFAIQDYRSSKFSQAQSKFQKVLSVYAGDVAANHYKERCLALLERPERKEWDVVWTGKEHTTLDLLVGNI